MAPVYSKQLFLGTCNAGVSTTLYTVAAGTVVVLRDLELLSNVANTVVGFQAGGLLVGALALPASGQYFYAHWEGRLTLGAGNSFAVYVYGTTFCNVAASGYLLTA